MTSMEMFPQKLVRFRAHTVMVVQLMYPAQPHYRKQPQNRGREDMQDL
jgi:hypothetical protein